MSSSNVGSVGGHHGLDGLVDFLANALGFIHHYQYVGAVETLELVGAVGGQAEGVTPGGKLPAGVEHLAAQGLGRGAVEAMHLSPQDVAHLPEGGRGAEDDGGVLVDVHEPQHGHGGAEALAQAVSGFHRDAAVGGEGVEHLLLLLPESYAQHFAGEGNGRRQRRGGALPCLVQPRSPQRGG